MDPFLRRIILLFFLVTAAIIGTAQDVEDWVRFGDESTEKGDHYGAAKYYRKALRIEPERTDITYKYAQALRRYQNYEKAAKQYKKVYEEDRRGEDYPKCLFWLATMEKYRGHYREAGRYFSKLKRQYIRERDSYYYKKAEQEKEACDRAEEMREDTVKVDIENLGKGVNTTGSEFAPHYRPPDSLLFFSALRAEQMTEENVVKDAHYNVRVYRAKRKKNGWKTEGPFETIEQGQGRDHANTAISEDGKRIYYARCDQRDKCRIMMIRKEGDEWGNPEKLRSLQSPDVTYTHPALGRIDGQSYLFFASDREGGKGKLDIWYAPLDEKGKPGEIQNAGDSVNTMDDDVTPFYDDRNQTLYFSSKWHLGMGGFDIFRSEGVPGTFSAPENLGHPVNTRVNDLYFAFYPASNEAFLTSNREGSLTEKGKNCCNDLYLAKFPNREKTTDTLPEITDLAELNRYLPVTLYFHNDRPGPESWDTTINKTYMESYRSYKERLPTYKEKNRERPEGQKRKNEIERFFAERIDQGVKDLEAFTELLLRELKKAQRITLTIKGYASPLAKTDYNVNLTLRRISSLKNYLRAYKDGVFIPYMEDTAQNRGALSFVKKPFGEYRARQTISDEVDELKESVYSRAAALERKIEIVHVQRADRDSAFASIKFSKEVHDFGRVEVGDTLSHTFYFRNTGERPLRIKKLETSCGCTVADYPEAPIEPGENGTIEVHFNTRGKSGMQTKTVLLTTNGIPEKKRLSITAEVEGSR